MDVELIFKIAAVGIIVAVLTQLLIRSGMFSAVHRYPRREIHKVFLRLGCLA